LDESIALVGLNHFTVPVDIKALQVNEIDHLTCTFR
jgi:hypothetical protein